jgi:hypothetical protein
VANNARLNQAWSKRDLAIGTAIALAMGTTFVLLSSGLSLIVTFVPGVLFAWLTYVWLYSRRTTLPSSSAFYPLFFSALAVQFLHFAEEFVTRFQTRFPSLYNGEPYSDDLFVVFNMVAYATFTLACILGFLKSLRFLLVPVLFFVVYGTIGNAIAHTWWSLYLQSYFPGFVTAQVYWLLGPLLLYRLLGSRKDVITIIMLFALVLIPVLTIFITRPG